MNKYSFYFIILLWVFIQTATASTEIKELEKDDVEEMQITMAPNSKFLNPHVDDATNLQFAVAAFKDEPQKNDKSRGKLAEILNKLAANSGYENSVQNENTARTLRDLKFVSFLQSLIGENNYKFKKL